MCEKKKKGAGSRLGFCPFCTWSRYSALYRDTGRAAGAHGQAGHGHDTAKTWPRHGQPGAMIWPAGQRYSRPARRASGACARMAWQLERCRDTINCFMIVRRLRC